METKEGSMSTELIPTQKAEITRPLVSPEEARIAWAEYEKLKASIVSSSDVQKIEGKDFLKKSYWRKIERFFGLKLELLKETREWLDAIVTKEVVTKHRKDGSTYKKEVTNVTYYPKGEAPEGVGTKVIALAVSAYYRATAPSGQYADGDGHCDTLEKGTINSIHNVIATAHTRAKNRAISDLVGGGEVSAEEVMGEIYDVTPEPPRQAPKPAPPSQKDASSKKEPAEKEKPYWWFMKGEDFLRLYAGLAEEKVKEWPQDEQELWVAKCRAGVKKGLPTPWPKTKESSLAEPIANLLRLGMSMEEVSATVERAGRDPQRVTEVAQSLIEEWEE
jgi:hypothetical protein